MRDKVIDYRVVITPLEYSSTDASISLETMIREHMASGWQPIGGVSMVQDSGSSHGNEWTAIRCAQAMVRYGDGSPKPA